MRHQPSFIDKDSASVDLPTLDEPPIRITLILHTTLHPESVVLDPYLNTTIPESNGLRFTGRQ
jgi:hypothetical protein